MKFDYLQDFPFFLFFRNKVSILEVSTLVNQCVKFFGEDHVMTQKSVKKGWKRLQGVITTMSTIKILLSRISLDIIRKFYVY